MLVSDEGLNAGGIGTSVENLSIALAQAGHDVVLMWPQASQPKEITGVCQLYVRSARYVIGSRGFLELARPPTQDELNKLPKGWQPDVVHAMRPTLLAMWAYRLARRAGAVFVLSMHEIVEQTPGNDTMGRALRALASAWFRFAYGRADLAVSPSKFVIERVEASLGLKVELLSNSLDLEGWRTLAGEKRPRQQQRICAVINLSPYKNPHAMLELWLALRELGTKAQLHIAGRGVLYEEVQQEIKLKNLSDSVQLVGALDRKDVAELLRNSDALLLTSKVEVQPMVVIEAKTLGLPVFVSDEKLNGARWQIEDDKDGLLLPSQDSHAAAQKIAALLNNPSRFHEMSQAALRDADKYSLLAVAKQATELYENALAKKMPTHKN